MKLCLKILINRHNHHGRKQVTNTHDLGCRVIDAEFLTLDIEDIIDACAKSKNKKKRDN